MCSPRVRYAVFALLSAITFGSSQLTATASSSVPAVATGLPCSVTVGDRVGDAILSDGGGPYVDGVGGIQCTVFQGASGDVTFYLTASGKKAVRYLYFNYTSKLSGSGPVGAIYDYSTMSSVQTIDDMVIGTTESHTGGFTTAVGRFAFNPSNWPGSATLSVTRMSAQDLTISATTGVNDIAALSQDSKRGTVDAGRYHMPFELLVHCDSCS